MSRLDDKGLLKSNTIAKRIQRQIQSAQFVAATSSWSELEDVISSSSNDVDFYNFLLDAGEDSVAAVTGMDMSNGVASLRRYSRYLSSVSSTAGGDNVDLSDFMNRIIRKKLKIIPDNVTWGGQSEYVFRSLQEDFMKPRINEVDELLAKGVEVTIYNGQVDLICSTKGTESWVHKLKWDGLQAFLSMERTPLYCGSNKDRTKGFTKSYKNLRFYWILGAGHFVPVDQPCVALEMVGAFTRSPAAIAHK